MIDYFNLINCKDFFASGAIDTRVRVAIDTVLGEIEALRLTPKQMTDQLLTAKFYRSTAPWQKNSRQIRVSTTQDFVLN